MSGDKLVVSYEAIQSAQRVWSDAAGSITSAFGAVAPVGGEELYAKSLDAALKAYRSLLTKVGVELETQAKGLSAYLTASEQTYRYVDATALTRAVPYNPDRPSPTMVVTSAHNGGFSILSGYGPVAPGQRAHGLTGTTAAGVPSGAGGSGTVTKVDGATAKAQERALPKDVVSVTDPSLGSTEGGLVAGGIYTGLPGAPSPLDGTP